MDLSLENTKYIGLGLGILGIIAMAFLIPETKNIHANELGNNIGQNITTTGTIRNLELRNENAFFELENNGTIKAVFFKPGTEQLSQMHENDAVRVWGTATLYK